MKVTYSKSLHNKPRCLNSTKSCRSFEIIKTGILFLCFQEVLTLKLGKTCSSRQRFCFALCGFIYSPPSAVNIYTLFDGLTYKTCGYFASCVVFFPSPAGARKNTNNEQNVRSYYMLNHRIRGLLFHYKKKLSGNWLLFFGKSIQRHPDSVWENDVNN